MKETTTRSTGHLAMSQTSTAVAPRPSRSPTSRAIGPVMTTATSSTVRNRIIPNVIRICIGRRFQNDRPSSIS